MSQNRHRADISDIHGRYPGSTVPHFDEETPCPAMTSS